ncbi:MAG: L,D-transpeptidase [Nitrospira sp.]|nr:L,D-transpeptidase [Nitrospira sp.]MBH0183446.1 L,D-transpeptidase [Nitrospira sp.]MBH0186949.1 L,D-transpeptidase [Nitrospira sp.]
MRCEWRTGVVLLAVCVFLPIASHAEPLRKPRGPCAVVYPSDAAVEWFCRTLHPKESLETVFGEYWVDVARFNRIDRRHVGAGVSIKVPKRVEDLASFTPLPLFYQAAEQDEQFILVDLSEQFLGAYEYGALRFSLPITSGNGHNPTPTGEFRLAAAHRRHQSSLFMVEGTDRPYPMNYALRFHINRKGVSYWMHGRDLPGYPASHGCIGLYDELMQQEQYGIPKYPELNDAKRLFEWVFGGEMEDARVIPLPHGPRVRIIGQAP